MKNICGKIPVELHEKVRAEIEEKETSTQIFIRQVIEEHFNRLENKGEESMEKRTLAVQVTEELFQRVKWAVAKEGIKQKDFIIRIKSRIIHIVRIINRLSYPAAGLITYYRGHKLVVINKTPLRSDLRANLVITGAVGETLSLL